MYPDFKDWHNQKLLSETQPPVRPQPQPQPQPQAQAQPQQPQVQPQTQQPPQQGMLSKAAGAAKDVASGIWNTMTDTGAGMDNPDFSGQAGMSKMGGKSKKRKKSFKEFVEGEK